MSDRRVREHRTHHWTGVGAVALVLIAVGVLVEEPGLVLSGGLGIVFAGYAGFAAPPRVGVADEDTIEIRRALDESNPDPGDDVTVTVEIRNAGDGFLPDVRVADGVPEGLEVSDGSSRHATAIRAGHGVTFSYSVTATRGAHVWQPAVVVASDPSGSIEREAVADADTTLRCTPSQLSTGQLPLRDLASPYAGRLETKDGGAGVEFFSSREYRPNDPLKRIDWRRLARRGELGTLQFTEERAATVVLLVDARRVACRAHRPSAVHAVQRGVTATVRVFDALLESNDRAGVAVFGPEEVWLAPGLGREHRARGEELLATHPALSPIPPTERMFETFRDDRRAELLEQRIRRLETRLPDDAQVVAVSPCCDDDFPRIVRRLEARGHDVTLLSPDPTADDTAGRHLARMERADRLRRLRRQGLRVIDWRRDERLSMALSRARARWSR